uniref:Uncharacterized protein n=1 Tax=Oryza punctata TaxID=4537 RepID=A0A0E0JJY4_ORYPU
METPPAPFAEAACTKTAVAGAGTRHLEVAGPEATIVAGEAATAAKQSTVLFHDEFLPTGELRRNKHATTVAENRIPYEEPKGVVVEDEDEAVAASEEACNAVAPIAVEPQGEAIERDEISLVKDGSEDGVAELILEDAKEGRILAVDAEATEEVGVGDEAAPLLADKGGVRDGGWLRGEVEEDLLEEVIIVRWRH